MCSNPSDMSGVERLAGKDELHLEAETDFRSLSIGMMRLKRLNRSQLLALDEKKSEVEMKKERVGSAQLALENLLYKRSHLLREMKACKDFISTHLHLVERETNLSVVIRDYSPDLRVLHKQSLQILRQEIELRTDLVKNILDRESILGQQRELLQKKRRTLDEYPEKLKSLKSCLLEIGPFVGDEEIVSPDVCIDRLKQLCTPLYILYRGFGVHASTFLSVTTYPSEKNMDYLGNLAIELTIRSPFTFPSPCGLDSGSSEAVFLFHYHSEANLILVRISRISVALNQRPLPFLFKPSQYSSCLLPSSLRQRVFSSAEIDVTVGEPEIWAQWFAGLQHLPVKNQSAEVLSVASFIDLVSKTSGLI